jgi:MFS family permease
VAALFLTNGAMFANVVPRYPEIKADLGIGNTAYGLAIAAFPAGAMAAGLAAGVVIRRFGSARVAAGGMLLTSLGTVLIGLAPSALSLAAVLFTAGAMDSITDVAQNAHGLRVQRRYSRSIINSFHAVWSIGAVLGGVMAAGALAIGLSRQVHLTISATLFAAVVLVALRYCLPGNDEPPAVATSWTPRSPVPTAILGSLVLLAIAATVIEDAGNSWAAVYLSGDLHAQGALAATGYIALVGAQFIGRVVGDRLVDRYGQRPVARAGGVVIAAGMGAALAFPTVPCTILGFAAAGLGVATLVPAVMHEADELPGLRHGTGLTVVSWLMRLGFLLSPPVVGLIADAASLRLGLILVPAAGILVVTLAGVLRSSH